LLIQGRSRSMQYSSSEDTHQPLTDAYAGVKEQRPWFHTITPFLLVVILVVGIIGAAYAIKNYNATPTPSEPTTPGIINVGVDKDIVRAYYENGQYADELWALCGTWMNYWTTQTYVAKNSVVFDIDETILDNMPEILANDFAFIPATWNPWVNQSAAPAFPQTLQLYNYLIKTGYDVIFITGRHDTQDAATVLNLQRQNITGYAQLITRTPAEYSMTATQYKSQRRQSFQNSGAYNIVGCIGDQLSDCVGGYAGYIMKLPNYAYFIE